MELCSAITVMKSKLSARRARPESRDSESDEAVEVTQPNMEEWNNITVEMLKQSKFSARHGRAESRAQTWGGRRLQEVGRSLPVAVRKHRSFTARSGRQNHSEVTKACY